MKSLDSNIFDVCLITQSHACFNPRLVKEADALCSAGYNVAVISPVYSEWGLISDGDFSDRAWKFAARPEFGPRSPKGKRVIELARRVLGTAFAKVSRGRLLAAVNAAWHPVTIPLIKSAKRINARLYIAHYPAALPAAAEAAKKFGGRYAFDAEDFHLGDPPDGDAFDFIRLLTRKIESRYLPGARYVSAASPGIAEAYQATYGIQHPEVLLNVFPLEHAPNAATDAGVVLPGPSVYWFSQTIGPDRGLECAVEAISLARARPHLYLRGQRNEWFSRCLKDLARKHNVYERVHFLPLEPPHEMERLAQQFDVGLVAETGVTRNRRIALTNKLFSYLLGGVPVLLSDIPAHIDISKQTGISTRLFETESPESLADAMDAYLFENPEGLRCARRHAFELGQDRFNWDVEANKFLQLVKVALE